MLQTGQEHLRQVPKVLNAGADGLPVLPSEVLEDFDEVRLSDEGDVELSTGGERFSFG